MISFFDMTAGKKSLKMTELLILGEKNRYKTTNTSKVPKAEQCALFHHENYNQKRQQL